jgi:hypothetical protein
MQDALHHPDSQQQASRSETTGGPAIGTNGGTGAAIRSISHASNRALTRVVRFSLATRQGYPQEKERVI